MAIVIIIAHLIPNMYISKEKYTAATISEKIAINKLVKKSSI
jgi:hypothetical protein